MGITAWAERFCHHWSGPFPSEEVARQRGAVPWRGKSMKPGGCFTPDWRISSRDRSSLPDGMQGEFSSHRSRGHPRNSKLRQDRPKLVDSNSAGSGMKLSQAARRASLGIGLLSFANFRIGVMAHFALSPFTATCGLFSAALMRQRP